MLGNWYCQLRNKAYGKKGNSRKFLDTIDGVKDGAAEQQRTPSGENLSEAGPDEALARAAIKEMMSGSAGAEMSHWVNKVARETGVRAEDVIAYVQDCIARQTGDEKNLRSINPDYHEGPLGTHAEMIRRIVGESGEDPSIHPESFSMRLPDDIAEKVNIATTLERVAAAVVGIVDREHIKEYARAMKNRSPSGNVGLSEGAAAIPVEVTTKIDELLAASSRAA